MILKKIFFGIKYIISNILNYFLPSPGPAPEGTPKVTDKGLKKILFILFIFLAVGIAIPLVFDFLKHTHLIEVMAVDDATAQTIDGRFNIGEAIIMLVAFVYYMAMPVLRYMHKWLKVTGSLYAFCVGYVICFSAGIIKQNQMITLILSVVLTAVLTLPPIYLLRYKNVMLPKPLARVTYIAFVLMTLGSTFLQLFNQIPYIGILTGHLSSLLSNTNGQIFTSLVKIVIAVLFIFLAFDKMRDYSRRGVSKQYEWMGAFTAFYTVSIIIFKIDTILTLISI